MPRKHDFAKGTIAELLDQIVLVELVLKALRLEQMLQAFKLALLRVKVQQSRPVWWYVGLHGIENFRIAFVVDFLWLSDSQMTLLERVSLSGLRISALPIKRDLNLLTIHSHVMLLELALFCLQEAVKLLDLSLVLI